MKKTMLLLGAMIISMFVLCGCDRETELEESAIPLVTDIFQDQFNENVKCISVTIIDKISSNEYEAEATLDNGEEVKITIEDRGDTIFVNVDPIVNLEKSSVPIVTNILKNQFNLNVKCLQVKIKDKVSSKNYAAEASLDNGEVIKIDIEDRGSLIYVTIPNQ